MQKNSPFGSRHFFSECTIAIFIAQIEIEYSQQFSHEWFSVHFKMGKIELLNLLFDFLDNDVQVQHVYLVKKDDKITSYMNL